MANVTLKIKIDVASLDAELQKAVEKIRQQLEKIGEIDIEIPKDFPRAADQTTQKLKSISESTKKVGDFSKRDLGIFANQLLLSSGITGRIGNQLSNLATALASGGFIGAAFAGASALINSLTENSNRWNNALREAAHNLVAVKDGLEGIKVEITSADLDRAVEKFQAISDITKEMMGVFTGGKIQTEIAVWLGNLTGALPDAFTINEEILEVLKEQQVQLKANLIIADAYARSLGFESFEAYKQFVKSEEDRKKKEEKAQEDAKRRAEEKIKLQEDVFIRAKTGQEKELVELQLKYNKEKELASGNQTLLLSLEEEYNRNKLAISLKYARMDLEERQKFHQQVREAEEKKLKETNEKFARLMAPAFDIKAYLDKIEERDRREQQLVQSLTNEYEQHFNAIIFMAENATNREMNFAKQASQYIIRLLQQELIRYIATKIAETTIHAETETAKTAATETGVIARLALLAMEIVKTLASAAASIAKAIAEGIAWLFATMGPFALAVIPAVVGATLALWAGIKKALGFRKGGFTGEGDPDDPAGIVHKKEFVFEAPLVSREPERFALLHSMLRGGITLADIFNRLAMPGVSLAAPGGRSIPIGGSSDDNRIISVLRSIDDRLKKIEEKEFKVKGQLESKLTGKDLAVAVRYGEKELNKNNA